MVELEPSAHLEELPAILVDIGANPARAYRPGNDVCPEHRHRIIRRQTVLITSPLPLTLPWSPTTKEAPWTNPNRAAISSRS